MEAKVFVFVGSLVAALVMAAIGYALAQIAGAFVALCLAYGVVVVERYHAPTLDRPSRP